MSNDTISAPSPGCATPSATPAPASPSPPEEVLGLFGRGEISVADKIAAFVATMDLRRKPGGYPKILCYLVYRHLEGRPVPLARVLAEIGAQIDALTASPVSRGRQVWLQSLRMAQCYLAILEDGNFDRAVGLANMSIAAYSGKFNPGGIVNVLRAFALWAAIEARAGRSFEALLIGAQRAYKDAIPDFPIFGETHAAPWLVACLEHSARALQILSVLATGKLPLERAARIEPVQPFCAAFQRAAGL